jgi:glycerol-3-phosphate dehydrogenase (NAD(P)+)
MSGTQRVAVIGAGSWGTALANIFADQACPVVLWGRDADVLRAIAERQENERYLKGVPLSLNLKVTEDLVAALDTADIIVCGIPTQQIRKVFEPHRDRLAGKVLVNSSKGIELGTHARVSEIFASIAPKAKYAMLSGPSFALEVARRLPAAVTVAAEDIEVARLIQKTMSNGYFRIYTSDDVIGVEIAGALKNVVAIATGLVNGLKLGYNAQAALINRGIAEIMRMGSHFGAQPLTFLGLAGTGDLILTCTGPLSRNRNLGIRLGEGRALSEIQKELGGVAEGVYTAQSAWELAHRSGVEMPITEQVYNILYKNSTAQKALQELMSRDLKEEWSSDDFRPTSQK